MEKLYHEKTGKTPMVSFDPDSGVLEVRGRSIPENSLGYYAPIMDWLDEYSAAAPAQTTVHIQLEYFNTASSKCILDLLKKMSSIHVNKESEVTIHWHYEEDDEDMLEAGEDYEAIIDAPFELVEFEEE